MAKRKEKDRMKQKRRRNKAVYTAYDAFTLVLIAVLVDNSTFAWFQLVCDRPTDQRMDRPTDGHTLL